MRLKDKVALVTGGSRGIGAAIAERYGREGARVAVGYRERAQAAERVAEAIAEAGGTAAAFGADLADVGAIRDMVGAVEKRFGPVDVLVNNAGVFWAAPVEETTEELWDRQLAINLKGAFFCVQQVVPGMKAKGRGKIINISSIAGLGGFPNSSSYCASKGGVVTMTKALCLELARYGINVNCIAPGNVATEMNEALREDPGHVENMRRMTPTGRAFMEARDLAGAAVFLASDDSDGVHGVTLLVDDGFAAW